MTNLFNEQMSSLEARIVLYSNANGKTKEEKQKMYEDYKAILPIIIKRETYEGSRLLSL